MPGYSIRNGLVMAQYDHTGLVPKTGKTALTSRSPLDDWVILAPTRWKLRAAIRLVNETLAELKLQQHPDKTFIGRVSRGLTSWAIV